MYNTGHNLWLVSYLLVLTKFLPLAQLPALAHTIMWLGEIFPLFLIHVAR